MKIFAAGPVNIGDSLGVEFGKTKTLGDLLNTVLSGGLLIAGIIVIFLIIGGGLKVIMSAGNDDPKGAAAGKQALTWGIGGFLLVLSAFYIIRFIEKILDLPFVTFPGF